MHATDGILAILEQYGYLIVFFGVVAESAGVPLPGETILIPAGILAQRSGLDVEEAILFGVLVEWWLGRVKLLLAAVLVLILLFYLAYRWVAGHRELLKDRWDAFLSRPPVARTRERYDRQLGWLLRRMTPGQYLGLHLTLGLLVAAGCLWLFGGLAEDYLTRDPIVRFDQTVANALHEAATPFATRVFLTITVLGSIGAIALVGLVVTGFFVWRRRWLYASGWLLALGGAVALNALLKQIFERPRPTFVDPILVKTSYSFPSGHAMDSLVMYGMLAYFTLLVVEAVMNSLSRKR